MLTAVQRKRGTAQRVRTAADVRVSQPQGATRRVMSAGHPLVDAAENARLYRYESRSKAAFDKIETVLRQLAQYQHEVYFASQAQETFQQQLGFTLPESLLEDTWVRPLDMSALYAACVFETFRRFADEFYQQHPLASSRDAGFQSFIESCGFHTLDISPCADGRLAHLVSYVLRLPYKAVRRKSYAGAMFDVEDNLHKWVETEYVRHREAGRGDIGRYLKVAVYHFSSSLPDTEGCAAHGSDVNKAAAGALGRLLDFQQSVENSFCCGASIDLLLLGIDTDNDTIRVHLPDAQQGIRTDLYIDAAEIYELTRNLRSGEGEAQITRLVSRLLLNNLSQIDYVREHHQGRYADIGHQERFIGMGLGFEEVQLRNLTYFAYLKTVELGARDMDVGIKIFTGLNIRRGLPAPVVIRYDYHGTVPGARERAVERCAGLDAALRHRFPEQSQAGLLHTLQVVRDCEAGGSIEVIASSVVKVQAGGH